MQKFKTTLIFKMITEELIKIISKHPRNIGIEIMREENPTYEKTMDMGTEGIPSGTGIYIGNGANNHIVISNAHMKNLPGSGFHICEVHKDSSVILNNITAYGSGLDGLTVSDADLLDKKDVDMDKKIGSLIVTDSNFDENLRHGINLTEYTNAQIINSTGSGNFEDGLHVRGKADDSLQNLLKQIMTVVKDLQLSSDIEKELLLDIATTNTQLESPNPKKGIINESLSSIRNILEGAAGSELQSRIPSIIFSISSFMMTGIYI